MKRGLGTQLRHLIELLDGAVEASFRTARLDYRPRFTPMMLAPAQREPSTLDQIASDAGTRSPLPRRASR